MTKVININERGTLTLPKPFRERLGVKGAGQILVEDTKNGILLRAGATFPIEIYSPERLREFDRLNETELENVSKAKRAPRRKRA